MYTSKTQHVKVLAHVKGKPLDFFSGFPKKNFPNESVFGRQILFISSDAGCRIAARDINTCGM
jgi:hypothetical protein